MRGRRGPRGGQQVVGGQVGLGIGRYHIRGVEHVDLAGVEARNLLLDERVVRASQYQGIDIGQGGVAQVSGNDIVADGIFEEAFLNHGHQQRGSQRVQINGRVQVIDFFLIHVGIHRLLSADEAHATARIRPAQVRHNGVNHVQHPRFAAHVLAHQLVGGGRGRVAGNHNQLAVLAQQQVADFDGIGLNGGRAFVAVGQMGRIAEVHDALVGQPPGHGPRHREAANAGVEHANGPGSQGRGRTSGRGSNSSSHAAKVARHRVGRLHNYFPIFWKTRYITSPHRANLLPMSTILAEIDQALATHDATRGRPVAIYLGERKLTQLTLDAARDLLPDLSTDDGRPRTYRNLELLRDEVNVDEVRVI